MATRPKRTALEEAVWQAWERVAFAYGGFANLADSLEEARRRCEEQRQPWDEVLAMAYVEGEWKVNAGVASAISGSRWYAAMILAEHERASAEIQRCLEHPEAFDRNDRADLPIKLHLPRLFGDQASEAAIALEHHLDCGIYSRAAIAKQMAHNLCGAGREEGSPKPKVSDELRSLVKAMLSTVKTPQKLLHACDQIQTWEDADRLIAYRAGFVAAKHLKI